MLTGVLLAVTATFLAAYLILDAAFGRTPIQRRLSVLQDFSVRQDIHRVPPIRRALIAAGHFPERSAFLQRLAERSAPLLDRLGGTIRPGEWLIIRFAVAAAVGVLIGAATYWPLGFPAGALVGYFGANAVVRWRIRRREHAFADELPGALNIMTSSLRSGFTLHQSVEASVRDDDGPVASELRRALAETRISGEFEDALERVGARMHSTEMVWLVMALRLQREVGGSLVDVMQTTADTMRERAYLQRHVRALSGEGRVSAYVLTAMPLVSALMIYVTQPDYLKPLVTEPLGLLMLAVATLAMVIGALWLRVVVQVRV